MLNAATEQSPPRPPAVTQTAIVRRLNDDFRTSLPRRDAGNRLVVTNGLGMLTIDQFADLLSAVRKFNAFTPDNDPYDEHDFGALDLDGVRYFWKIDYYDRALSFGSPNPADPSVTARVLTVMRADEY